jgi:hypothetical protein
VRRIGTEVVVAAKARLDRLDLYPRPVRITRVWLIAVPWLFAAVVSAL